jgi:predicted negative regulator of RcsB-dependent stress response
MKRIKRKQLKEDELVTTFTKVIHFVRKRSREIIAVVAAVVLAIAIIIGVRLVKSYNIKKESRMLGEILELATSLEENPENIQKLEEMAGKGKFSRIAYLELASYFVESGDLKKAEAYLQNISGRKKDLFYYQAQDLLAQIYTKKEEYDKAIEIYQKIEKEKPREYTLDAVLFRQAEALEQKGEIEEALALYKKVQEDYPQTFFGYDASQKVQKLEEKK